MTADAYGNLSGKQLVVFGCGYVGGELARQALARGLKVTALTRNAAKAVELRAAGITAVVAELGTDAWHEQIPGTAEFVLNCVSSGCGGVEGYRRSYVNGMQSILRWARRRPVGTIVYTSSTSVYPQGQSPRASMDCHPIGDNPPDRPPVLVVDETASTEGAGETARVLLEAEALLRHQAGACGRWFILRLAGIYGPGRHSLLDQLRGGVRELGGRGDHHLNLIHRDDIAAAIWAAFTAPPPVANEIFNVADGHPATKTEIAAWLAARLGVPAPRFTGEPAAGRRTVTPDRIISNARLRTRLAWEPRFAGFRAGYENLLSR